MKALPYMKNGEMIAIQLLDPDDDYASVERMIHRNPFSSKSPITIPPTHHSLVRLRKAYKGSYIAPEIYGHFRDFRLPYTEPIKGLYPHQNEFVRFALGVKREFGSVRLMVGDDPRMGKSIESLTLLNQLSSGSPGLVYRRVSLVLCPKSLISQWIEYVLEWTEFDALPLEGSTKQKTQALENYKSTVGLYDVVVITNWESLHSVSQLVSQEWFMVIGDEAHRLKNHKSNISRVMRAVKSRHMLLMSATFTERTPAELWSPLRILHPEMFTSYWRFVHWFVETKQKKYGISLEKPKEVENLKEFLYPYQIRRRIEDVTDIPETIGEVRHYVLGRDHQKFYDRIREGILLELSSHDLMIPNAVSAITRSLQAAIHPGLLDEQLWNSPKTAKLQGLVEVMEEIEDTEQVIVYSNFRLGCKAAQWALMEAGYSAESYLGNDADEIVEGFKRGEFRVLCTTPQKGGIGLNLRNADYVVYLNIPWSTISYRQSRERPRAIEKQTPVHAIHLIAEGTIDQRVYDLVVMKKMSYVKASDLYREMLGLT